MLCVTWYSNAHARHFSVENTIIIFIPVYRIHHDWVARRTCKERGLPESMMVASSLCCFLDSVRSVFHLVIHILHTKVAPVIPFHEASRKRWAFFGGGGSVVMKKGMSHSLFHPTIKIISAQSTTGCRIVWILLQAFHIHCHRGFTFP